MVRKTAYKFREFVRDIVFGMEDGLVSNLGIVFAVWVAGADRLIILLAGLASLFAGSLSMSAGSYLSSKSQREVYEAEIAHTHELLKTHPEKACKDLEKILKSEGFDRDEIAAMRNHFLNHNHRTFVTNYIQKKLKLSPERFDNPLGNAFAMFLAFSLGSLFPIAPFFFGSSLLVMSVAGLLTVAMLFFVGVVKTTVTHRHWFKSGIEMVGLGLGAGVVGYFIGELFNFFL